MRTFKDRVKDLLQRVNLLCEGEKEKSESRLPNNCYFLTEEEIVCFERGFGDSRYPYDSDGLTLWTYSSGNLKISEGLFNVILDSISGKEPAICFYAGRKLDKGYFPISLTGAGVFAFERGVKRFTVFSPEAAYYFTVSKDWTACVRMFVDKNKCLRFSICILNGEEETQTYVASYMNLFLRNAYADDLGMKFFKHCKKTDDGFMFGVVEDVFRSECILHYANVVCSERKKQICSTTSQSDFTGGTQVAVNCSLALQKGRFEKEKSYTEFTENAVAATIIPLKLAPNEYYEVSYTIAIADTESTAINNAHKYVGTDEIDNLLSNRDAFGKNVPDLAFEGNQIGVKDTALNRFCASVFRQTEFCARAKNYSGALIGIRDIFQQLEAALIWIPDYCRGKILEALNYIGEDGRAPRQYSYPEKEGVLPVMDLRPFIDQGVWIISTIYTYLAYTNDYSILEEVCGYYRFDGRNVAFSKEKDSVLSHVFRIMEYLLSNLDKGTYCLHVLYGDWNDALDGMGESIDGVSEYGSGVSVMATLQFYQNLREMSMILRHINRSDEATRYESIAEKVADGLQKYAIDIKEDGARKIIHGWGDKYSYKVGSWLDNDGMDRDGLTSNTFWILSGMIDKDRTLKTDILRAYDRLDSKYGLKTFEPYFSMGNKKVGRITHLPRGTAENGATYIHATMFAIWSLFEIGETERAWKQLEKVLPLTHSSLTTSPFVMPNSYSYDIEKGFDGESMSDWFTGSGCVFVKILIWHIFGIQADLDGLTVCPSKEPPIKKMSLSVMVKGVKVLLNYQKLDGKARVFKVNGIEKEPVFNDKKRAWEIRFDKISSLSKCLQIDVIDK